MNRPRPSLELINAYRRHKAALPPFQSLYPYAMGRVEQALSEASMKPADRIKYALTQIAALDIVLDEPLPDPEPAQCPECGFGSPGHRDACTRRPLATLGPRQ